MHLHQDGDWCCCLRLPFDSDKIGLAQCLSSQQILSCNNCTAWVFYLVTICTAHCSCNICYKLTLYLYICESKNSTCVEILKLLYRFIINGVVFYIVFLQSSAAELITHVTIPIFYRNDRSQRRATTHIMHGAMCFI